MFLLLKLALVILSQVLVNLDIKFVNKKCFCVNRYTFYMHDNIYECARIILIKYFTHASSYYSGINNSYKFRNNCVFLCPRNFVNKNYSKVSYFIILILCSLPFNHYPFLIQNEQIHILCPAFCIICIFVISISHVLYVNYNYASIYNTIKVASDDYF